MKTIVVFGFVLLAALATNVAAYPAVGEVAEDFAEEGPQETVAFQDTVPEHGVRMKRATCDLLSFQSKWVTPNHSACAAHCLALFRGFKGGRCRDGVCHCRK